MAKLPQFVSDARLPATGGATEIDARFPISGVGRAVGALADKAVDVSGTALVAAVHAREENEATRAYAETTQKLDTLRLDLDKDPDYANREAKFNDAARALEGETVKALSPGAARTYQQRLAGLYQAQAHSVRAQARKDENDALRVELDGSIDTMLESALGSRNKVERLAKLGEIEDAIRRASDTGVLTYAEAKRYHKSKLEKFDEITVSRVMRTAPGAALALLGDKAATPNLDPLRREQLKIQAQARSEQMGALAKADARADVAGVIDAFQRGNFQPANLDAVRRKAAAFPELSQHLNQAEYVYRSASDFAAKDAPEQARIIASARLGEGEGRATPQDTALRDAYEKIHANLVKSFLAEPMATAMQRNTAAADAFAAAQRDVGGAATESARQEAAARLQTATDELVETQRKNGVPEYKVTLLAKSQAEALEANIKQQKGQARLDLLDALRAQYRPDQWTRIYRQLDAGQHLPPDVSLLGGMPQGSTSNGDRLNFQRAMSLTEDERKKLVPEPARKSIAAAADTAGEAARETLARIPDGGAKKFAELSGAAHQLAEYLFGTKQAPTEAAAGRMAWDILYYKGFATAGAVAIPKRDGVPALAPDMVASYQEFAKRTLLPGMALLPPPPGPSTAHLSDETRAAMRFRTVAAFGYFVADGEDRGMVLLDGNGEVVRDAGGRALRWTWREIESDARFRDWYADKAKLNLPPLSPTGPTRPVEPRLLLPTAPPGSRDRIEQVPAYRRLEVR